MSSATWVGCFFGKSLVICGDSWVFIFYNGDYFIDFFFSFIIFTTQNLKELF